MRKIKAAEAKKAEAERLQAFLQEMLKEEENKYCADCEAKQPRWASWNIGVFLCIRCAGLHRNLGVHVSKVKSVTLDSWTSDQIQSMRVMGNAKARAVYECELPTMFRRPQTDQSLEAFIRAKYETKRYVMKDWVPPRVDAADLPSFASTTITSGTGKKVTTGQPPTMAHHHQHRSPYTATAEDKDDNLFGPFATAGTTTTTAGEHAATIADTAAVAHNQHNHQQQQLIDVFAAAQPAPVVTTGNNQAKNIGVAELLNIGSAPQQEQQIVSMSTNVNASSETKTQNILELIDFTPCSASYGQQPAANGQQQQDDAHQLQQLMMAPPLTPSAVVQQQQTKDAKMSTNEILALFGTKR